MIQSNDLYYYTSGTPAATSLLVIDIVNAQVAQIDANNVKLSISVNSNIPLTAPNGPLQGYYWLLDTGVNAPSYWNPYDSNDLTVDYTIGVNWGAGGNLWVDVGKFDGTVFLHLDGQSHLQDYFSSNTCSITIPLDWLGMPSSIKWVAGPTDGIAGSIGCHDKAPNSGHLTLNMSP
jgi:hypothetical protein